MDRASKHMDFPRPPGGLMQNPGPAECSECHKPVEATLHRQRWYPSKEHPECRSRRVWRASALREAEKRILKIIPSAYHGMSLADESMRRHPANTAALKALHEWEPHQSAILTGPVGTGKTAALCAFAQDQMRRLRAVQWYSEADVVSHLKAHMREGLATDPIARLLGSHVLVIDDVGTARPTEWWTEQFAAIVDRAYSNERAVVLSTNLTEQQLIDHYPYSGERLVSRLRHMTAPDRWVSVSGVNFRELGRNTRGT